MRIVTAIAIVLLGCGDDTNAGSVDAPQIDARSPDARSPDAAPTDGSTDGMPPDAPTAATVGGTIVIADVSLVDPAAASLGGISGGSIDIAFDDLDDDPAKGGVVTFGTSPINGCVVTEFNPTHPPHATLDVGTITISDDATASGGLLKTVGPCTYQSASGQYACISNSNATEAVVARDLSAALGKPVVAYAFPTATTDAALDSESLVGSLLSVNGFSAHPTFNSGTGAFPILKQLHATTAGVCDIVTTHVCTAPADRAGLPCATSADCDGPSTLIVLNAAASGAGTETAAAIPYLIINGATPIPTGGIANTDFLGTGKVDISKPDSGEWPAISAALDVPGQGWSLSDPGDPTAFPSTAQAVNFGCGNGTTATNDDTCGDPSTALLQVMIVAGRGTKQNLATACSGACQPFQMPVENPSTDTWVEWTCVYIGAHTATMPQAAVAAILSESPTRVEVRVINAAATIQQTGPGNLNTLNLLVGHAIVGHTTF